MKGKTSGKMRMQITQNMRYALCVLSLGMSLLHTYFLFWTLIKISFYVVAAYLIFPSPFVTKEKWRVKKMKKIMRSLRMIYKLKANVNKVAMSLYMLYVKYYVDLAQNIFGSSLILDSNSDKEIDEENEAEKESEKAMEELSHSDSDSHSQPHATPSPKKRVRKREYNQLNKLNR